MQDDNTTQPGDSSSTDSSLPEPPLSLSTNPADSQAASTDDSAPAGTPATEAPAAEAPLEEPASADASTDTSAESMPAAEDTQPTITPSGDLETIKTSALQELAPLVDELDQEPEERYRTLMMIIQSSDNQELVKEAYEAAQKIEDKKAKAEALLNILNEINYFTGKAEKSQPEA